MDELAAARDENNVENKTAAAVGLQMQSADTNVHTDRNKLLEDNFGEF